MGVGHQEIEAGEPTAFRDAILKARRESVEVLPQFDPVATAGAPAPRQRFEYRVEPLRGSRKRRRKMLERLGRKGWELVAVDDGSAYLKRPVSGPR